MSLNIDENNEKYNEIPEEDRHGWHEPWHILDIKIQKWNK